MMMVVQSRGGGIPIKVLQGMQGVAIVIVGRRRGQFTRKLLPAGRTDTRLLCLFHDAEQLSELCGLAPHTQYALLSLPRHGPALSQQHPGQSTIRERGREMPRGLLWRHESGSVCLCNAYRRACSSMR